MSARATGFFAVFLTKCQGNNFVFLTELRSQLHVFFALNIKCSKGKEAKTQFNTTSLFRLRIMLYGFQTALGWEIIVNEWFINIILFRWFCVFDNVT